MALNCVNCGGALSPVGNRHYFQCPYCDTFHFPEETPDGVAVIGDPAECGCPVCEEPLVAAAINGHPIRYCLHCCGFLAENSIFSLIVQNKRAERGDTTPVPMPFTPSELKRRVHCPRCRHRMDTHPYHGGGNAVIDTCYRCRLIWLDAGEISVIGSYAGRGSTSTSEPAPSETRTESPTRDPNEEPIEASETGLISLLGFLIRLL